MKKNIFIMLILSLIIISLCSGKDTEDSEIENVNFYIKLPQSWLGTIYYPDHSKKLISSFYEIKTGQEYYLELEHHETKVIIRIKTIKINSDVDIDLTDLTIYKKGKNIFMSFTPEIKQSFFDQFGIGESQIRFVFPNKFDAIYFTENTDIMNIVENDWQSCTFCKYSDNEIVITKAGTYGTAKVSIKNSSFLSQIDQLLKWKELIAALIGLIGLIFWSLRYVKRKTIGEEKIELFRNIGIESGQVKLTIKINNHSTFTVRKAKIFVDVPENLQLKEPAVSPYDIGDIPEGEEQSITFYLLPIRRVTGFISGKVDYLDKDSMVKSKRFKNIPVPCLCSFMEKKLITEDEFDKKLEHHDKVSKKRKVTIKSEFLHSLMSERCSVLQKISERQLSSDRWVGKYFAVERHSNKEFGLMIDISANDEGSEVNITSFGDASGTVSGLAEEIAAFVLYEEQNH